MQLSNLWVMLQLWQPKGDDKPKASRGFLSDGMPAEHHYNKYNTQMGLPFH